MKRNRVFRLLASLTVVVLCMTAFSVTAFAGGGDGDYYTGEPAETTPEPTEEPATGGMEPEGQPLTPEGNATLVDDYYGDKQLITVITKAGNYFYILIDRANEDKETAVHFLNQVDEADLMALLEDGQTEEKPAACTCAEKCQAGAVNTACPVCAVNMSECAGKAPEVEPEPEPEPEPSDFNYDPALSYREAPSGYLGECSQAGTVVKETYNGIHGSNTLNVYLPYGYDENKKYNIFYLMHGGGENENTIFSDDVKLDHILDHMIMNGELEPLIVVTPTFNKSGADKFYEEFRKSVVPFVEGKYSTYAASTSEADLRASRMHRAYGGFSMGSLSTWCVANHAMDLVGYFMPLSGDNWEGMGTLTNQIDSLGYKKNEYFIFAATGDEDIAYNNMVPQMNDLKSKTNYFTYTSDFSKGNLYFLVAPGKTHWWGFVRHYVYDALPYFFHENQ